MLPRCLFMSSGILNRSSDVTNGDIRNKITDIKSWNGSDGKYDLKGNLKWNAYSMTRSVSTFQESFSTGFKAEVLYDIPWSYPDVSNLELKVLNALADQIKDFDFNALVALGERAQTIKLVTDSVKSLVSCVKHVKRGNISAALKAVGYSGTIPKKHKFTHEDVASRFLEIQYGWIPLLNDVHGAMDAYHSITRGPRRKVFKSSSLAEQTVEGYYVPDFPPKGTIRRSFKQRVVYYAELSEPPSTARELGLLNPLSLAWELLPFSFVADWFIPIGTYLDDTAFFFNLEGKFLHSLFQKMEVTADLGSYWSGLNTNGSVVIHTRELPSSITVPAPAFKPLHKSLSSSHVTNAVALLTGIISGSSRVK